jgi:predicted O-methyltransferase YrrM
MSDDLWTSVDNYFSGLLVPQDSALDAALKSSTAAGLPAINVAPNQGKLLMILAQAIGARRILEIGTLGGYSTIWLARALAPGGKLITLEYAAKHATVARENVARAGLAGVVEIKVGRAIDTLPTLAPDGPFDLVFIDADKPGYTDYFEWSMKLTRKGSLIVADNVVRKGAIVDAHSSDPDVQGMRRFNDRLASEPRVNATVIQTVGVKGYDGLAIAVVTADA